MIDRPSRQMNNLLAFLATGAIASSFGCGGRSAEGSGGAAGRDGGAGAEASGASTGGRAAGGTGPGGSGGVDAGGAGSGPATTGDGGTGGTGGAGTGGTGGLGTGGSAVGAEDAGACRGSAGAGGGPAQRHEAEQCYVTEVSLDGAAEPSCAPADDPMLVQRLYDYVSSCGFVTEFVYEATSNVQLPAECEPLIECCASMVSYEQTMCNDVVDAPSATHAERCANNLAQYRRQGRCGGDGGGMTDGSDGGGPARSPDAGDADSPRSRRHVLCCYRTCGHTHCN